MEAEGKCLQYKSLRSTISSVLILFVILKSMICSHVLYIEGKVLPFPSLSLKYNKKMGE